jgi:hypothetical protein
MRWDSIGIIQRAELVKLAGCRTTKLDSVPVCFCAPCRDPVLAIVISNYSMHTNATTLLLLYAYTDLKMWKLVDGMSAQHVCCATVRFSGQRICFTAMMGRSRRLKWQHPVASFAAHHG